MFRKINNLVDIVFLFKGQLHNQSNVDMVKYKKYLGMVYDIIEPDKTEVLQQTDEEQYLVCSFIC